MHVTNADKKVKTLIISGLKKKKKWRFLCSIKFFMNCLFRPVDKIVQIFSLAIN